MKSTHDQPDKNGRYHLTYYDAYPFYIKPSFSSRWGPTAWQKWLAGVPLPGDEGDKYMPQGYKIEESGPKSLFGKGAAEMKATKEKLDRERTGGCPFSVLKA